MQTHKYLVWVVEDEDAVRKIAVKILKRHLPQIRIRPFSTAERAIQHIVFADNRFMPDLVIIDHHLGERTGEEVVAHLKARTHGKVKSLGISADESQKYVDESLAKPFLPHELADKVKTIIESIN